MRQWRGLRFKMLQGKRSHQYSMRLNKQFRIVAELKTDDQGHIIVVVSVEDYH